MQLQTILCNTRDPAPASIADLDSERTLVTLFGPSDLLSQEAVLAEIANRYPKSCLIGCSTAGEILDESLVDDSLVVSVSKFEHTDLRVACAHVASAAESFAAGRSIAEQLNAPGLRAVFVLSDGLSVNGSELVRGLNGVLPSSVIVTGGLAGDGERFSKTWVLVEGKPVSSYVTAVGLYGDRLRVGHGSRGGWDLFGPERCVTRAEGNVLYELDGRPALALYKEYLGELSEGLPATALFFPLALDVGEAETKCLVRTVLGVDESNQSMTFAGDLPVGSTVHLMCANSDRLIEGAADAASMARARDGRGPGLAIAISCVGRRIVLGERAEEELASVLESLPPGTHQVGFYSYGEISPLVTGACDLHNQTMTLTTFRED